MTVYQEAHRKIDEFPEDTVYLFIQLMDKMSADKKKNEGKQKRKFLQTAGRINIDETAVYQLREESVI